MSKYRLAILSVMAIMLASPAFAADEHGALSTSRINRDLQLGTNKLNRIDRGIANSSLTPQEVAPANDGKEMTKELRKTRRAKKHKSKQ